MSVTGIALDDWVAQGKVFRYRGHQIRWWEAGAGEPLLLIHGFPSGSWDWHYLWQALAERYRVIALDMIGFAFPTSRNITPTVCWTRPTCSRR